MTPATAAGVTEHFWSLEDLLAGEAPYQRSSMN
jgi:hypothetical protein